MTIMRMIGVPAEDRERLADAADALVSWNDDEFLAGREPLAVLGSAMFELQHAAAEIAAQRQREPQDDLISALVHAEIDGERLTRQEIAAFFVLLSVAGNDTTRHTTSHGMRALCDFREQRTYLQNDLAGRPPLAVEELVRWATPIMTFRRTATRDTEIAGTAIRDGQKVVMFYSSANRDERAFANPDHLDLARDPNRHVGFGGGGPHFCLGASIARCQLRAIFTELLTTYPNIEVGEPCRTVGNFVNAVASMPMQPGPRSKLTCEPT